MSKIAYEDIPEEDVQYPQITSPTEHRIYNLRPRKPMKHPGVDDYTHAQIVQYAMTQYYLIKGMKKFNKAGYVTVEKELNQQHTNITLALTNVVNISKK